jgi:hypothetical protein
MKHHPTLIKKQFVKMMYVDVREIEVLTRVVSPDPLALFGAPLLTNKIQPRWLSGKAYH